MDLKFYWKSGEEEMSHSRRNFFRNAAFAGTGILGWAESVRAALRGAEPAGETKKNSRSAIRGGPPVRMITPDIGDLPFEMDGGVKMFRLVAEPVKQKIVAWKIIDAWGYNGRCPGPTIQVT